MLQGHGDGRSDDSVRISSFDVDGVTPPLFFPFPFLPRCSPDLPGI